jgi:hypothetical protein
MGVNMKWTIIERNYHQQSELGHNAIKETYLGGFQWALYMPYKPITDGHQHRMFDTIAKLKEYVGGKQQKL